MQGVAAAAPTIIGRAIVGIRIQKIVVRSEAILPTESVVASSMLIVAAFALLRLRARR